ncbi:MbcA/ParS/Xre antitoxin family protein [Kushneria aurantia]|uniref:Antitoxin Xre/MbcA/ParS toxin-binding domain-containing protein n=1 Tax=Kushneria aurantia TaxID=504092 RepID=A0ABV6G817_9GAMM|nr:MbcA/ParS/Xre antitoxin family protein [Kushneria aurantia]
MELQEAPSTIARPLFEGIAEEPAAVIRTARQGVPGSLVRRALGELSDHPPFRELFIRLLETTSGNLHRTYQRAALPRTQSEEVLDLLGLLNHVHRVFGDREMALEWLQTPLVALSGELPIALCDTFHGRQLVRTALRAIEYGEFS